MLKQKENRKFGLFHINHFKFLIIHAKPLRCKHVEYRLRGLLNQGCGNKMTSVLPNHPGSENTILHSCRVCNSLKFGGHYFYSIHLSRES